MKKLLLAVIALEVVLTGCDSSSPPKQPAGQNDTGREFELWLETAGCQESANKDLISRHPFYVSVADTNELRQHGLAGREYLADNKGMLFIMPRPMTIRMWMKGCLIPLDVLFFDQDKLLINFHTMAVPSASQADDVLPLYSSDKPAKFALEVPARIAQRLGLQPAQTTMSLSAELLKRLQEGTE